MKGQKRDIGVNERRDRDTGFNERRYMCRHRAQ